MREPSAHGAEPHNWRKGRAGSDDGGRPKCQRWGCAPQPRCPFRPWLLAQSHQKAPLKSSIALGIETIAVSTYSHKNPSIVNEHLTFKRVCFHKQILLPEGQQVTAPEPVPHLCSRSARSLFMRAVVTCCSISNTSSHPVRIWVARAKILTFSS